MPDPKDPVLDYFGGEFLPEHLFPRKDDLSGPLHEGFYRDTDDLSSPYPWMPVRFADGLKERYGTYYTIANRMDYIERLIARMDDAAPRHVIQCLREVQDRYQLLSLHMELLGVYEEGEIRSGMCPPVDVLYPSQDKVFSIEELPDLYVPIYHCKFWGDRMDVPFSDSSTIRLVGILSKALPSPCKSRSVTTILPDMWKDGDSSESRVVFDCISRIVMGSLLGVYEHCGVRASFRVRRTLYRWFCMSMKREDFGDWIRRNKFLIIYVLREYAFYLISAIPSLDDYMKENYYWHHMKKNTYSAMDSVRRHANWILETHASCHPLVTDDGDSIYDQYLREECYFGERRDASRAPLWYPGRSWFDGMASTLSTYNKANLDFCHRPIESSFLDAVLSIIREIDDSKFSTEAYKRLEADFPKDYERIIFELVCDCHSVSDDISYEWLALFFKVKMSNVIQLQQAERLYLRETSRSKIQLVLRDLSDYDPWDYHVIKLFFFAMEKRMSVLFYDLPEHIIKKQIDSFFKMYETLPGHPLDENAGVYYYCPNCGELKAKVVPSDSKVTGKRDKERECTIAFERVSINMITGEKTCAKPASKSAPKKRSASSDAVSEIMGMAADQRKESKKQSKDSRKRKVLEKCRHSRLVRFCLIGKIMRTEKWGLVIICPWCLCLTTLGRESYKDSGGELSCGCVRTSPPEALVTKALVRCGICRKEMDDASPGLYLVYDDVTSPEEPTLRYVTFCKHHRTGPVTWIDRWNAVLRLSQLQQAVREGWKSIRLGGDGGDRVFVRPDSSKRMKTNGWKRKIV